MYGQLFETKEKLCGFISDEKLKSIEPRIANVGGETTYVRTERLKSKESRKWRDGPCVI